ncbi:hypothetical protein DBP22_21575 [Streptomyces sp. CS207]|nr:hypothetical protein DBP22_21575 [Streptomyces sp. CS207]
MVANSGPERTRASSSSRCVMDSPGGGRSDRGGGRGAGRSGSAAARCVGARCVGARTWVRRRPAPGRSCCRRIRRRC